MKRRKIRRISYHVIAALILAGIVVWGALRCDQAFLRFWESVRDFFHSIGYFFQFPVQPSVENFSYGMTESFPHAWEEFQTGAQALGARLISLENFLAYLQLLAHGLMYFVYGFLVFLVVVVLPFGICLHKSIKTQNRDYNKQTKPLRIFLKFYVHCYLPMKRFIRGFLKFFRQRKAYIIPILIAALLYMNVFTMLFEVIAWIFYFGASVDVPNLGTQAIKFCYDVVLMLSFLPWWAWCIVALCVINKLRWHRGFQKLKKSEDKLRKFILDRPIVSMICAPMREGKTKFLTSFVMSLEKIFRKQAKELMRDIDMKFPDFPWIVLEKMMQKEMKRHRIYTLVTAREWVDSICNVFQKHSSDKGMMQRYRRHLSKEYGICLKTAFFGYDTKLFPTEYDCGLGKETIYENLRDYVQLYLIYTMPTSLILSNFPVRMDDDFDDAGNFPLWDDDFFKKDPSPLEKSRFSHVLSQDSLRLGKVKNPDNPYKDALEFGGVGFTEIGKERGNQKDMEGVHKDADEVNQKNDLFNAQLKLIGHSATVYFNPFIRFVCDEQRPDSWGADARQLCDIITLCDKSPDKIVLPFFAIEQALYLITKKVVGKLYDKQRYNRGDHTLSMWLFRAFYKKIYDHYKRIDSIFGGYNVAAKVEAGTRDQKIEKAKIFISKRKTHSKRYPTDAYRGFYSEKAKRSRMGLNDIPTYQGLMPTMEEYRLQESLFFDKLFQIFGEQAAQEIILKLKPQNTPTDAQGATPTDKPKAPAKPAEQGKTNAAKRGNETSDDEWEFA